MEFAHEFCGDGAAGCDACAKVLETLVGDCAVGEEF